MATNDVNNPYGLGAHALDKIFDNYSSIEVIAILFMLVIFGFFVSNFFRNKSTAKTLPPPAKNCEKCLFDRNMFADFYAEYRRHHETLDARQRHMIEELERIERRFNERKDKE